MAFDAYLVFIDANNKDVPGESTDSQLPGWIEFQSFSYKMANPTTIGSGSGGSGAGKVTCGDFTFKRKFDLASCSLGLACCTGDHFSGVNVILRKAAGKANKQQMFIQFMFNEVYVTSVLWTGQTGGDDTPEETVTFSFGKFNVNYYRQDTKANMQPANNMSWSIRANDGTD
jgi:type VI secretion system secreted protein Hcp